MQRFFLAALLAATGAPALANDSVAELGTGGIVLSRSDSIAMESEDLFLSRDKVTVDYVFRNGSDKDIDTIVAFPMPDIEGNPNEVPSIPDDRDNFLDFEATMDGKPLSPQLEQRAFAAGLDISADLKAQNVPFYPFGDTASDALAKLPQSVADDWLERGIIVLDEFDDGSGWKTVRRPYWQLRSTYWWRATFPAGKPVRVSHRYKPSVGATVGLNFYVDGKFGDQYDVYKKRYCMDADFEKAVRKVMAIPGPEGNSPRYESRLSYILTTGGNWAAGTIGKFRLTVDKSYPASLVSFCGDGVKKIGPTTFQMTAQDFDPAHDIDILLLDRPQDLNAGGGN
ncbi:MAG: DUF4424 domain-containing protein [Mesorhizobium sp.]|nr:DUF4424 domain-containing protein [Mesorhizobium sp.]